VPFSPVPVDLGRVFGRSAPQILEIGFGMGETTAALAQQHPENDYLGVEVHTPGVGSLLARISALHLTNVRIVQHDAVEVLERMLAPGTLARRPPVLPRPLAKKRPPQAAPAAGPFRVAARDEDEIRSDPARVHRLGGLRGADAAGARGGTFPSEHRADYAKRPDTRPQTKFERRGLGPRPRRVGPGVQEDLVTGPI